MLVLTLDISMEEVITTSVVAALLMSRAVRAAAMSSMVSVCCAYTLATMIPLTQFTNAIANGRWTDNRL